MASVALFDESGSLMASGSRESDRRASFALAELLQDALRSAGASLGEAGLVVADIGPGSFSGTRVGVTMAKTLAYALGVRCAGSNSFDLVALDAPVAIPCGRDEFLLRVPGGAVEMTSALPAGVKGYGVGGEDRFPDVAAFAGLLGSLQRVDAAQLVPMYVLEPSISTPKRPLGAVHR